MTTAEIEMIERTLPTLPPEARAAFEALLPPWWKRHRRLNARDAAVRVALALLVDMAPTAAQQLLAAELARAAMLRRQGKPPPASSAFDSAVIEILHRNEWTPIGPRQIANIAAGVRRV